MKASAAALIKRKPLACGMWARRSTNAMLIELWISSNEGMIIVIREFRRHVFFSCGWSFQDLPDEMFFFFFLKWFIGSISIHVHTHGLIHWFTNFAYTHKYMNSQKKLEPAMHFYRISPPIYSEWYLPIPIIFFYGGKNLSQLMM